MPAIESLGCTTDVLFGERNTHTWVEGNFAPRASQPAAPALFFDNICRATVYFSEARTESSYFDTIDTRNCHYTHSTY